MAAAVARSASPMSSPRLPSPPPFPEVQIGAKSPGMSAASGNTVPDLEASIKLDQGPLRRIRPGTKAADFAGPPLVPLSELDSPFQLQEHLKALHYQLTRSSSDPKLTTPITRETALTIASPPQGVDRPLWLYELCRLLVQRANTVCVSFFREDPPCSAATCPEMRASEWQYLCAVHEPPKSCCAIDYCCHTLEWAADLLTSSKFFPSRLTLGSEANGGSAGSVRQMTNVMRRVYRIFAHAWFQHRGVFWQLESEEGLYILFKTVCDVYSLIPEENYTIPPEAEGLSAKDETSGEPAIPVIQTEEQQQQQVAGKDEDEEGKLKISTGATTRRHKATPSIGSSVTTIQEGDEEGQESSGSQHKQEDVPASAIQHPLHSEPPLVTVSDVPENESPPKTKAEKDEGSEAPKDVKEETKEAHGIPEEVQDHDTTVIVAETAEAEPQTAATKVEEKETSEE